MADILWSIQAIRILGVTTDGQRLYVGEIVRRTGVNESLVRNIVSRLRSYGIMDSVMETLAEAEARGGGNPRRYYWLTDRGRTFASEISDAVTASRPPTPVLERVPSRAS